MLIDDFVCQCRFKVPTASSDGKGGRTTTWTDGDTFSAATVLNKSSQAIEGEKRQTARTYTITIPRTLTLNYHDVFVRVSDGQVFRVTAPSEDTKAPPGAGFAFAQATAEEWRLPT